MKSLVAAVCTLGLLSACATGRPDHFYILTPLPQGPSEPRTTPATQATLKVNLPSLVDRSEMILNTSADAVVVLDHERWAAPLTDLVTQALARDLERRRVDWLVTDRLVNRSVAAAVKISVDVVQMTVHRGGRASIEAHWRIVDPRAAQEVVGGGEFSAALGGDGYANVAQAFSDCLGQLADRVVGQMR